MHILAISAIVICFCFVSYLFWCNHPLKTKSVCISIIIGTFVCVVILFGYMYYTLTPPIVIPNEATPDFSYPNIDHVLYINLSHRQDRKQQIESTLEAVKFPLNKITRIDATYNKDNGHKGCSMSHIRALEHAIANNYENVLILEDDFEFSYNGKTISYMLSNTLNKLGGNYDVVMLSGNVYDEQPVNEQMLMAVKDDETGVCPLTKINHATTTSGYIVHNKFYHKLLNNFKEALSKQKDKLDHTKIDDNAIDQHWVSLQPQSQWFKFSPALGKQRESYSDILKGKVNYELFVQTNKCHR